MNSVPPTAVLHIGSFGPNMAPPILRLPVEVLTQICSYLPANAPTPFIADLASICRVNRLLHQIATPILYRDVHIDYVSTFGGASKILRCFLDSELKHEHSGIRYIRSLRISEGSPRPDEREDYDSEKGVIREDIAKLVLKIRPDQLSSLYAETADFREVYQENLGDQNNLKNLQVRYRPSNEDVPLTSPFNYWSQRIRHYTSRLTDAKFTLRLSGLTINLDLVTVTEIDIKPMEPGSLLRPIRVKTIPILTHLEDDEEKKLSHIVHDIQSLLFSLLSAVNGEAFYIEELDIGFPNHYMLEPHLEREALTPVVGRVRKLVVWSPSRAWPMMRIVLPFTTNLTDLRLFHTVGQHFLERQMEEPPFKLKILYIVDPESTGQYISQKALMPHAQTLEVLWLESSDWNGHTIQAINLPLSSNQPPNTLNWSFLISGKFPKLREVAVCLDVDTVEAGLVGENFELLRILNEYDFQSACKSSIKGLAEQAFNKIYKRGTSPKFRAIAFGTPNRDLSARRRPDYEEISIFFGRKERDMLGREVARCTPVNARQARYMLPGTVIIEEDERSLRSVEKWPKSNN
ncbi:hypothetical protein TWF594_001276 [Orbilia oligospora]|nr:hypothetical protein TWF594_001276 [Orbilia oligospora]